MATPRSCASQRGRPRAGRGVPAPQIAVDGGQRRHHPQALHLQVAQVVRTGQLQGLVELGAGEVEVGIPGLVYAATPRLACNSACTSGCADRASSGPRPAVCCGAKIAVRSLGHDHFRIPDSANADPETDHHGSAQMPMQRLVTCGNGRRRTARSVVRPVPPLLTRVRKSVPDSETGAIAPVFAGFWASFRTFRTASAYADQPYPPLAT